MLIDTPLADRFITAYAEFFGTLVSSREQRQYPGSEWMAIGRDNYLADRSTLQAYRAAHPQADAEMLDAIGALQFGFWIYLKDTRGYSIFLDEQTTAAYGVLGLTDRLRDITGGSGLFLRTGVVPLGGRWVCDGLLEDPVIIGSNMREGFTDKYQALRQAGRFSTGPAPA